MRRAKECPPGVMELLIVDSLADFAGKGRATASLGGVPLASDPSAPVDEEAGRAQQLLGWVYQHGGDVYDARGLFRFKEKFAPRVGADVAGLPRPGRPAADRGGGGALLPAPGRGARGPADPTGRRPRREHRRRDRVRAALGSVRDRFVRLDRAGPGPWWRRTAAPAVWALLMVAAAAATWGGSLTLRPGARSAGAWSAQQVLDGQAWRLVTATVLTRDPTMLVLLVVVTGPILWVLARLTSTPVALLVWAAGAVWGFAGTTLLLRAGEAAGWGLATTTLATVDVGPSGGTAAAAAVVTALMRHRLVTAVTVTALVVGSALHHQVADVEHLITFTTALVVTSAVARLPRRRGAPW